MVILTAGELREWDRFTIEHEPISSINLMERAARSCVDWLEKNLTNLQPVYIFCGKGNNGGDGLAIGRLLESKGFQVDVYILEFGVQGTPEFQHNLHLLNNLSVAIHFLPPGSALPEIPPNAIIIDALLGSGINRAVEGRMAELICHLNASANSRISLDLPSGMQADESTDAGQSIQADITLSFQCYKPAFLLAGNTVALGDVHLLDIGLHPAYQNSIQPKYDAVDETLAASLIQIRQPHAHKGSFGHALLLAGSEGKMGAAILAARAVLRTGAGLLTCLVPQQGLHILQVAFPEAMAIVGGDDKLGGALPTLDKYAAIGCGPGIGTHPATTNQLGQLLNHYHKPLVIDADALNILAENPVWLANLPPFSILTPHPREFDRLAGISEKESNRWERARELAMKYQLIIVLKGHHTFITMPGGKSWFNFSGNASMAKGGSGDVLTGMLTGLLARGYSPEQSAILGVYLHGLAGEIASHEWGMESVLATDICNAIGKAYLQLTSSSSS